MRTDVQGMLGVATRFYRELFEAQEVDEQAGDLFIDLLEGGVPEAVRVVLELPVSLEELTAALKGMKGGRVPGMDGIPKEFYLEFWDILGPDFLLVLQHLFVKGELSPSMREGVVSLLFMKGDPEELKNWRPLTMLDDVTLFLTEDRSVEEALGVVGEFGKASGSALNVGKCKIRYFGSWEGRTEPLGGMAVCDGRLRVLGVEFGAGDNGVVNWEGRIAGVRKKLGLWQQRRLSLSGKVLVLKSDVLSSLVFLSCVFPLPARLRKGLTRAVFSFLWGSYEYVQRATMYQPVAEGGAWCAMLAFEV